MSIADSLGPSTVEAVFCIDSYIELREVIASDIASDRQSRENHQMAQKQSPGYPNFPLEKAIALAGQIFEQDRKNPIDRSVAASHIGYNSVSGASDKSLGTLAHYQLVEKAGKGQIRVTQTLVDILYPDSEEDKRAALLAAGLGPALFKNIYERFSDGTPSESALKAWLMRENFLDRAISPVTRSYLETIRFLQQSKAFEGGGEDIDDYAEPDPDADPVELVEMQDTAKQPAVTRPPIHVGELNEINAEITGSTVRISALLDREGLEKLERKITALKDFLSD